MVELLHSSIYIYNHVFHKLLICFMLWPITVLTPKNIYIFYPAESVTKLSRLKWCKAA